jgi:hypothetical protein
MEIGLSSFGAVVPEGVAGGAVQTHVRMQDLLEEMKVADEVGLDVFALGEHHRPDFIISAPEVILAAAATITQRIKLSSAVTVLSSADPVRTFQNFASLDLISNGRAEIMAGRGSFIESFPLFGYSLDDYDALFFEKLDLLLKINQSEKISWKGKFRASLQDQGVYPRPLQPQLPVWLAIGGTPASAVRAGGGSGASDARPRSFGDAHRAHTAQVLPKPVPRPTRARGATGSNPRPQPLGTLTALIPRGRSPDPRAEQTGRAG